MGKEYLLGFDAGTYESKGTLCDIHGKVIATAFSPHLLKTPAPGYAEHDPIGDWWEDFKKIVRELLDSSGVKAEQIAGIGISTVMAGIVPVDADCHPLRPAILYGIDARATEEMEQLTRMYGQEQILAWYGRPLCSSDVMPKILWIKNKEPEVYAKTCKFLTGSSYITAKLTGSYVVDRFLGLASFNPLYDPETWKPVPELCAPVCLPDQLAEIR